MPHWWCPQTGNIGEALTQLFPPCMDLSDDESISLFSKFQCSQFFIILFFEFSVIKMDIIVITCIFWNLKRSNTAVNRYTRIACRKLFISTLAHTQEYVKHMFHGNNLQVRQIDYQTMSEIPVWRWLFCYWQIAKNTIYYDHRYSLNAMN